MPIVYTCNKGHMRTEGGPQGPGDAWHEPCPECGEDGGWVHFPEHYEIICLLGRGGMGSVFKARSRKDGGVSAVKILAPGATRSKTIAGRFLKEARAVDQLSHPNIVRLTEAGEYGGNPFLAMDFVDGPSLDRVIAATPQPVAFTATIMEALARAIAHSHGRGILHRDLKPSNVILGPGSEPLIVDFGLAKFFLDDDGMTMSGLILGTLSYMAPEQARGENKTIGPAADIYGLGGIFYEMLTGRCPFAGSAAHEALLRIVYEVPEGPRVKRPEIPPDIETICLKCLQKDPRDRYASGLDLADDLRRFLDGEPIKAHRSELITSGVTWARIDSKPEDRDNEKVTARTVEIAPGPTGPLSTIITANTEMFTADERSPGMEDSLADARKVRLFEGLNDDQTQALLRAGHCLNYDPGGLIFSAGDPADGLYLILRGTVRIFLPMEPEEVLLNKRKEGEILGELGLLLPRSQRTASARAEGPATLFKIPGNPIEIIRMFADPATAIRFMRNLLDMTQPREPEAAEQKASGTDQAVSFAIDPQPILRAMERALPPSASAMLCVRGELEAGQILLQPGAEMDGFWVIHEGTLEPFPANGEADITAPCIVGEVDFFSHNGARSGLRVKERASYAWYRRSGFEELLRKEPRAALSVLFSMLQLMVLLTLERDSRRIKAASTKNT